MGFRFGFGFWVEQRFSGMRSRNHWHDRGFIARPPEAEAQRTTTVLCRPEGLLHQIGPHPGTNRRETNRRDMGHPGLTRQYQVGSNAPLYCGIGAPGPYQTGAVILHSESQLVIPRLWVQIHMQQ